MTERMYNRETILKPDNKKGFKPYMYEVGTDLRHGLWELKERTGVPMAVHLRQAVAVYLETYAEVEALNQAEELDDYERHREQGRVIFDHLRLMLEETGDYETKNT